MKYVIVCKWNPYFQEHKPILEERPDAIDAAGGYKTTIWGDINNPVLFNDLNDAYANVDYLLRTRATSPDRAQSYSVAEFSFV